MDERLDARERTLTERELAAERVIARERELEERQARLDDREARLREAEDEIIDWRRRVREVELRVRTELSE